MSEGWEWLDFWKTGRVLGQAFQEQVECIRHVYSAADGIISSPPYTPAGYEVSMARVPDEFYYLRKNLFSTLFYTSYFLLGISQERRLLYGKLNHLFRTWVTSADNLLDDEDKVVIPIRMPGRSRVMRQVVSIMAADRIMKVLLDEAVQDDLISAEQAGQLSSRSLQILLPSAAQEATEEGGISERPHPDHVLSTIHKLKTGILFNIPFLGPEVVEEDLNLARMGLLKDALLDFGIGCQLLDDIRDVAKDYVEGRHNYVLSTLAWNRDPFLATLGRRSVALDDRLYLEIPQAAVPAARLGLRMMKDALICLSDMGLGIRREAAEKMAAGMFAVLDLGDLAYA